MLGFIPMNRFAIVYRQSEQLDKWGQPQWVKTYEGKCHLTYNEDLKTVSQTDGFITVMSASVFFKEYVEVYVGDKIVFNTHNNTKDFHIVSDLSYFEDYSGKIVSTRCVVAKGKVN